MCNSDSAFAKYDNSGNDQLPFDLEIETRVGISATSLTAQVNKIRLEAS